MPPPRIALTEWTEIIEAVGDLLPVHLISLICSSRTTYLAFDLARELRVACLIGNINRINDLLRMGADPDATDGIGLSALDIAHWLNRIITIKHLLVYLDIEEQGATRLIQEISRGRSTVVRALLDLGVREQLDEEKYRNVLKIACTFGTLHVVNVLVVYAPDFLVSSYEDIFVQAALSARKLLIATYIRDIASWERYLITMDVSKYMISDDDIVLMSPTISALPSDSAPTLSISPSQTEYASQSAYTLSPSPSQTYYASSEGASGTLN